MCQSASCNVNSTILYQQSIDTFSARLKRLKFVFFFDSYRAAKALLLLYVIVAFLEDRQIEWLDFSRTGWDKKVTPFFGIWVSSFARYLHFFLAYHFHYMTSFFVCRCKKVLFLCEQTKFNDGWINYRRKLIRNQRVENTGSERIIANVFK